MAATGEQDPFAVKIPGDLVERLSLKEGDRVSVSVTDDGKLLVRRAGARTVAGVDAARPTKPFGRTTGRLEKPDGSRP